MNIYLKLILLTAVISSCSSSKNSNSSNTKSNNSSEYIDKNNSVVITKYNSENIGTGSTEIIFNGENNEVIIEQINALFNSSESHQVIIIDGSNNYIKFTTKESIINSEKEADTIRIVGDYNSLKFLTEFVIENDSISSTSEILGNFQQGTLEQTEKYPILDTSEMANKFTNIYMPAHEVIAYYKTEAASGNLEARYYLGEIYLIGMGTLKNLAEAKFHLFIAAQGQHINAAFLLGSI